MNYKKLVILTLSLIFIILIINFVFGQSNKFTLFKIENRGFKFITTQNSRAELRLDSDEISPYLLFGSSTGLRAIIRPSHYGGSYIYSTLRDYTEADKYVSINLRPNTGSVYFLYENRLRPGLQYAAIYANLEKAIAIYNCSWNDWLNSSPVGTCLGKRGYYTGTQPEQLPPGVIWNQNRRIHTNPNTCFGNNAGRVLQEICTGDCGGGNGDDSALTICVLD